MPKKAELTPQEIAQATGVATPPKVAKPKKPPTTIHGKISALAALPYEPKIPFNQNDPVYLWWKNLIVDYVSDHFKYDDRNRQTHAILVGAKKSKNVLKFLLGVAQIYGITLPNPKKLGKLKPGDFQPLIDPKVALSAKSKAMLPSPAKLAEEQALIKKIAAYEAEIARLKEAQYIASQEKSKAQAKKEKLSNIDPQLLKYFSYIDKHCGTFLKSLDETQRLLFRGQRDADMPIFLGMPRDNRKPKDSNAKAQELLDKFLTMNGFKALRSNSIFTSTRLGQADNFGHVYAIFPKDGFNFLWTPKEDDLVIHSVAELLDSKSLAKKYGEGENDNEEDLYYDLDSYMGSLPDAKWPDKNTIEYLMYSLGVLDTKVEKVFSKFKASKAAKELSELMKIWNQAEYDDNAEVKADFMKIVSLLPKVKEEVGINLISSSDLKQVKKYVTSFTKEAEKSLDPKVPAADELALSKKVIKRYGFTDENFDAALKSSNEICINGEYVAVNFENKEYKAAVIRYFLKDDTSDSWY